jgi:Zinc-binding dehydrogenase
VCAARGPSSSSGPFGADHVVDYTDEDFTRGERRYDVILDNVLNRRPSATARDLSAHRNIHSEQRRQNRRLLAGLPRMAPAAVMRRTSTLTCVVKRENLEALATILESGDVRV